VECGVGNESIQCIAQSLAGDVNVIVGRMLLRCCDITSEASKGTVKRDGAVAVKSFTHRERITWNDRKYNEWGKSGVVEYGWG
jgi:hypothetical protein